MNTTPDHGSLAQQARGWTMNHFSITLSEVPELLRRVADALDELGEIEVYDVTFKPEEADKRRMTVYFAFSDSDD